MNAEIRAILERVRSGHLSEREALELLKRWRRVGSASPAGTAADQMAARLRAIFAEESKLAPAAVKLDEPFQDLGIDSLLIHRLNARLEKWLGPVSRTLFYEHGNLRDLAAFLSRKYPDAAAETPAPARPTPVASDAQDVATAKGAVARAGDSGEIAIIGLHGRYPGAGELGTFWRNLEAGKCAVRVIPKERWNWEEFYAPPETAAELGKSYAKWGGFLEGIDLFDPLFFRITPREAELMDPQERLFLESAWLVVADAGYTPAALNAAAARRGGSVGVFVGITRTNYQLLGPPEWARGNPVFPASVPWSAANRVSYLFDFHGPSLAVDTACSSSLTALYEACESIRRGDCAVAVAGGVNLYVHPSTFIGLCRAGMLSPDGVCRSFGAGANGFVPGEGVGAVVLKPLAWAEEDGDHIYGIIKSAAINHDGRTHGYTVPNPSAQAALIRTALERGGIDPRTISYIEGHGTGTDLGDPVEVAGLARAFGEWAGNSPRCAIGSVKSNIGHLEAAAGIAGLTKILLQMQHGRIVPSLHAERVNPKIDFSRTPFRVAREAGDWPRDSGPRRAGLSSFGAGGANVHVILEDYAGLEPEPDTGDPVLIVLSERNETRLRTAVEQLKLALDGDVRLRDMAFTLLHGRESMAERLAIVAADKEEARGKLARFLGGETAGLFRGTARTESGDDTKRALTNCAEAGGPAARERLEGIAAQWVAGAKVAWSAPPERAKPRRVSLAVDPFERRRYWVPGPEPRAEASTATTLCLEPVWVVSEVEEGSSGEGAGPVEVLVLGGSRDWSESVARVLGGSATVRRLADGEEPELAARAGRAERPRRIAIVHRWRGTSNPVEDFVALFSKVRAMMRVDSSAEVMWLALGPDAGEPGLAALGAFGATLQIERPAFIFRVIRCDDLDESRLAALLPVEIARWRSGGASLRHSACEGTMSRARLDRGLSQAAARAGSLRVEDNPRSG
ncbi:MAG: hypothetical protein KGS61_00735, partial [Verrucomicrobia bacterium]|nr:hypothetical protein [Verrucomicrobiota bacterium]